MLLVYVSVLKRWLGGGGLGVDGGWLPLPTHPQRNWDPASLVFSQWHIYVLFFSTKCANTPLSLAVRWLVRLTQRDRPTNRLIETKIKKKTTQTKRHSYNIKLGKEREDG